MFEAIAALGAAVLGGTLQGGALDGINAEDGMSQGSGPDEILTGAGAGPAAAEAVTLPVMDGEAPWFDRFDPDRDQVVVVYPDAMGQAGLSDLRFTYDEDFDETEVSLVTPEGARCVCFLPDVAPGEMDARNFDFVSESLARQMLRF